MKNRIKTIFKKLSKKPLKEQKKIINKFTPIILKDIKKICHHICHNPHFKKNIKIKKNIKYKNIIRKIGNSKSLKNIKSMLSKNITQKGRGIFTILGGILIPTVAKLIADAVN